MLSFLLILIGIVAVFFPFDSEDIKPNIQEPNSLLANLGGEGLSYLFKIIGGILIFIGITMIFS